MGDVDQRSSSNDGTAGSAAEERPSRRGQATGLAISHLGGTVPIG